MHTWQQQDFVPGLHTDLLNSAKAKTIPLSQPCDL